MDVGKRNGFIVVIKKSDSDSSVKKPGLTLACKRSEQYREDKLTKISAGL